MTHPVSEMLTLKTNKKPKHITITMKNQEENIQETWDNIKIQNLRIIGAEEANPNSNMQKYFQQNYRRDFSKSIKV